MEKGLAGADLTSAGVVAERVRMVVQAETDVTISLGVASFTADMPGMETLVGKADKALYRPRREDGTELRGYGLIPVFEDQARRVL